MTLTAEEIRILIRGLSFITLFANHYTEDLDLLEKLRAELRMLETENV